uniref:Uncharacterized protein n=1 Tax=Vespula pensylvanica TaxID=30213 RepID=A0A834P1T4_VESPE|nr:hypothetical protein H0235_007780 [Vespula pensylvanica]
MDLFLKTYLRPLTLSNTFVVSIPRNHSPCQKISAVPAVSTLRETNSRTWGGDSDSGMGGCECLRVSGCFVQYERGESVLEENGGVGAIMEMDLPSNKVIFGELEVGTPFSFSVDGGSQKMLYLYYVAGCIEGGKKRILISRSKVQEQQEQEQQQQQQQQH